MELRTILLSQYPALFLLAVLFLIAHLRARRSSAVRSVLWVLLFGVSLAASVGSCFLGIQAGLWSLKTVAVLPAWSWAGLAAVVTVLLLHAIHGVERRVNRRRLEKAMEQADKRRREEVSRAREQGAAEERERAEAARTEKEREAHGDVPEGTESAAPVEARNDEQNA